MAVGKPKEAGGKLDPIETAPPIIIKRIKKHGHDFHGGSWKVAFADFATAMMAFFLLLWIMGNTSEEEKESISGYFNDPSGFSGKARASQVIGEGGANSGVIDLGEVKPETSEKESLSEEEIVDLAEQRELEQLELLRQELEDLASSSAAFAKFQDQVIVDIIPAGLRIQIVDKDKRPMFDSGSAEPKLYSIAILKSLATVLKQVPNQLSITGHTDATPYLERDDYGNWELSADRANAARRALLGGGIRDQQVAKVEGFASSILFDKDKPYNPINRRIAIIVLKQSAADEIKKQVLGID